MSGLQERELIVSFLEILDNELFLCNPYEEVIPQRNEHNLFFLVNNK